MAWDLRDHITKEREMSEAFFLSVVLAFSGGFQDAYTYIVRDHVYANAQTGNVVMLSGHFMRGEWGLGLRYLFPLMAFALGVFAAATIHHHYDYGPHERHWRQTILAVEAIIMFVVGFITKFNNALANCLVSFACAMQVEAFRTVHGYGYASTMCIGNLRGAMSSLADYFSSRDRAYLKRAKYYLGVIFAFALGAGTGCQLSPVMDIAASWVCSALLAFSYWLMGWKGRRSDRAHSAECEQ